LADSPFDFSATTPVASNALTVTVPALNPSGTLAYAAALYPTASPPAATLYGATIDSTTGDLAEIAGMPTVGYGATTPIIDSTGKYLFLPTHASQAGSGELRSYVISSPSGQLTQNGAPVPTGGNNPAVAAVPGGQFLLVPNFGSPAFAVMAVD